MGITPSVITTLSGTLDVIEGLAGTDPAAVGTRCDTLESGIEEPVAVHHLLVGGRALLGAAYLAAHDAGTGPRDAADRAVAHLEQALGALGNRGPTSCGSTSCATSRLPGGPAATARPPAGPGSTS